MVESKIKSILALYLKDSQEDHFSKFKFAKDLKDLDQVLKRTAINILISEFRLMP